MPYIWSFLQMLLEIGKRGAKGVPDLGSEE